MQLHLTHLQPASIFYSAGNFSQRNQRDTAADIQYAAAGKENRMLQRTSDWRQRIVTAAVVIAMLLSMIPQAATVFADTEYTYQPVIPEGENANSMMMLDPSDITVVEETDSYILNRINSEIDGTKDIKFTCTMSAGMNNFNKDHFLKYNMPIIKIYDSDGNIAAQYDSGAGALEFLGSALSDELNNHGGKKTTEFYIGVDKDVLATGEYTIVFGKDLCGNNVEKILGKDIKFSFYVKATPELDEMITEAQSFLDASEAGDLPGQYPQTSADSLKAAIETAANTMADIEKKLQSSELTEEQAEKQRNTAAKALSDELKAFKNARIVSLTSIVIDGIAPNQKVGDKGTLTADVTVVPDEEQYRRVTWEASDNIIINSNTGEWTAAYAGKGWVRAVSRTDESMKKEMAVEITDEGNYLGVLLPDASSKPADVIKQAAEAQGRDVSSITALKLFSAGSAVLDKTAITDIRSMMPKLSDLDIRNLPMESIGNSYFASWAGLEKIVLPDLLKTIDIKAFYNCSGLKTVEIPVKTETIGASAFAGCTSLDKTLTVRASNPPVLATTVNEKLGFGDAFNGVSADKNAGITTIMVPYGCAEDFRAASGWKRYTVTEMKEAALTVSYDRNGGLAAAAEKALAKAGYADYEVTSIRITSPEGVVLEKTTDMEYLQTHFLGATIVDLSEAAFPDNNIQASTFEGRKNAKEIILPDAVTHLGRKAFYGCTNLRTLTVPSNVKYLSNMNPGLGESALAGCERLETLIMKPVDPPGYAGSMPGGFKHIYVPNISVDKYREAYPDQKDLIEPQSSVTTAETAKVELQQSVTLKAEIKSVVDIGSELRWEITSDNTGPVAEIDEKTGKITGKLTGSVEVTVTAGYGTANQCSAVCTVTVVRPDAVSLDVADVTGNSVRLSWTKLDGAAGYQVARAGSQDGDYEVIQTLSSSQTSYTDNGLDKGKAYYYRVRGYKTVDGNRVYGEWSDTVTAVPGATTAADRIFGNSSTARCYGQSRYDTATGAADLLGRAMDRELHENIIVACGTDYADALAGSYLAKVKEAPILLVDKSADRENSIKKYIDGNLKKGGTVYILGGEGVVTPRFEKSLKNSSDYSVKRLSGQNRYDTNIAILKEAGVKGEDMLVCTGTGFADSLSASAAGKPILLVAAAGVNDSQKKYLDSIDIEDIYLIGGTGVVSDSIGRQLKSYDQDGTCERVAGQDRYKTSVAVASKFFPGGSTTAVLAYAQDFPDGLSGGPVAMSMKSPLLLVDRSGYADARAYAKKAGIKKALTMGGPALIPDSVVKTILNY